LERFPDRTLLELQPLTGRTHQLRVHCAHMGYPILGDPQYGNEASRAASGRLPSQLLCAKRLTFPHPMTGEVMTFLSHQDAHVSTFQKA
jgi:23S rRNA-/tRNA-specific pseudouridylate synthase